jgi:hypothetical protein
MTALCRKCYVPPSDKRLPEPCQHSEVGVECDPLQPTDAQRRESVVVLQAPELALNCGTATVEVAEPLSVARDAWEEPAAEGERESWLVPLRATERNDRLAAAQASRQPRHDRATRAGTHPSTSLPLAA